MKSDGATHARNAYVHTAELVLAQGTDPAAVGAAVTAVLCGHWEHEGACRWPHNNHIDAAGSRATFRTLFVAPVAEESEVRRLIEGALRGAPEWRVSSSSERPVAAGEMALADGLASDALD